MNEFKDMLKYLRQRAGLSQKELAHRLGLSPSTVSMYEVGQREPDFVTEEKIADFFNVDLCTLRGKDREAASISDPKESALLGMYRRLNPEGKEKLEERAEELIRMEYTLEADAKKGGDASA